MQRRHKLRVQWFWWLFKWLFDIRRRVIWSDVCTGGRNPTSKLGMRESVGGDFFQGGVSLNIIIMWGGVEINFCLMRGGYDLVLGHISPISQPPPPGNYCTVPNCNKLNKTMLLSKISREFKNTGIFSPSNDTSRPSKDPYLWRQLLDKKFISAPPSHSIVSSCKRG